MNIFDIDGFTFAYPDSNDDTGAGYLPPALTGVDLHVEQGEFVVILGSSGCGKTTLLRQLKRQMIPHGRRSGEILFKGRTMDEYTDQEMAAQIGFVQQDVNSQLVTDKVWHELAFGLESMGYDNDHIRRRVAEMSSFFGLTGIFHRKVTRLSGGQKQLVNLASVMAMSPDVLILDEPTSQLDPIAANEFIDSLVRINRELGTTIIMTEHRLEEVLPVCSRAVVMQAGSILCEGDVRTVAGRLCSDGCSRDLYMSMPAAIQIYMGLGKTPAENLAFADNVKVPVTVAEGKRWLAGYDEQFRKSEDAVCLPDDNKHYDDAEAAVRLDEVRFRYDRSSDDVLRGVDLDIYKNEILMINGSNGSGKSTLLSLIAGIYKPYNGRIRIQGNMTTGMLPQNPELLFTRNSVRDELVDAKDRKDLMDIIGFCHLENLMDRHPYDLSGGEKQRLALARLLMYDPDILLMDEPTKGMDNGFKSEFNTMLQELKKKGKTIVIVSHDIEFCAVAGDRIALLFDGEIAGAGGVREYFLGNNFFTTAAARIAYGIIPGAVTVSDILSAYGMNDGMVSDDDNDPDIMKSGKTERTDMNVSSPDLSGIVLTRERIADPLRWWQIMLISVTSVIIIFCFWKTMSQTDLTELVEQGMNITDKGKAYIGMYVVMVLAIVGLLAAIKPVTSKKNENIIMESASRRMSLGTVITVIISMVLIPLTIWVGSELLGDKKYYFICLLIIIEAMIPFFVSFENRRPHTRDIVTLAVMCALAVAGRAAFFMVPNFSPTMAIVIISGVAFGCEGGFVVGAMSMFVSNFMMGQGPWTPWQMFAMGLVGFLAGLFFARSGVRTRNMTKIGLCIFGALICIIVYGGIMNPASVVIWQPAVNLGMIIASYVTGFPFDVVHGTATVIFLWLLARPFLEKLDRVRIKYGVL